MKYTYLFILSFKKGLYFSLCMGILPACMSMHGVCRGQNRASDSLELESEMVGSAIRVLGKAMLLPRSPLSSSCL